MVVEFVVMKLVPVQLVALVDVQLSATWFPFTMSAFPVVYG